MRRQISLTALALLFAGGPHAAQAQLSRTFVSAARGNDANNCERATPCRSFQGAHDKTSPDGEITVLDSGGYGGVTITKSISIVNDGVGEASILVSGGVTGITVQGGAATSVNLRGITVQGIGFGGGFGLVFAGGSSLTVSDCVIRNHSLVGIAFRPEAGGTQNLAVFNTLLADNGSDGILIEPHAAGANVHAVLDRVQMLNNGIHGLFINGRDEPGTIDAVVTDSVAANNSGDGFLVETKTGGARTNLTVTRSVAANNLGVGLVVDEVPTASLRVSQSAIAGNAHTWAVSGTGVLQSLGDNYIAGNADGDPAPPTIAAK